MRTINDLNKAELVTLTVTPAICSFVSFLGSATILYTFARDWKRKMRNIKHRLLAAICLSDMVNSTCYAFWALPIPDDDNAPRVWGAKGNIASCDVQGLFLHLGNIGAAYNGALAIYFLLSLRYGMRNEVIAQKYELYMHLWGLFWPLTTGLVALFLGLYNFGGVGCWIAPFPYQCHLHDDIPCTRGERAYLYAWTFTGGPLALTNFIIMACMVLTYRSVKRTYKRAQRPIRRAYNLGHLPEEDAQASRRRYAEKIKQAGVQAFLYSTAYFVTHMWAFIVVLIENVGGNLYFSVLFLQVSTVVVFLIGIIEHGCRLHNIIINPYCLQQFFWPLQGFFNVFIYLRPTMQYIRLQDTDISFFRAAYLAAFNEKEMGRYSWAGGSSRFFGSRSMSIVDRSSTFGFFLFGAKNGEEMQENNDDDDGDDEKEKHPITATGETNEPNSGETKDTDDSSRKAMEPCGAG